MAEPNSTPRSRKPAAKSQPITQHPLFAVIVGLWFAALLGLGSFALSTALLERLVLATEIDRVIPAAAPPLGTTARLLLAALFGLVGGAIGCFLAKRVANPAGRAAPAVFQVADADLPEPMPRRAAAPVAAQAESAPAPAFLEADVAVDPEPEAGPETVTEAAPDSSIFPPAPPAVTAAQRIADADLASLSHVELVERLAIALQRRDAIRDEAPDVAPETVSPPAQEAASPVVHFPGSADRRGARPAAAPARAAPQETEKALRDALAQLQRMSRSA